MQAIPRQFLNTHSSMMMHVHIIKKRNIPYNPEHIDQEHFWNMVTDYFKISREILESDYRKNSVKMARFYCWMALREAKWKLEAIGDLYKKNHTTIMNGLTRLEGFIDTEMETRKRYEHFKKYISIVLYA